MMAVMAAVVRGVDEGLGLGGGVGDRERGSGEGEDT